MTTGTTNLQNQAPYRPLREDIIKKHRDEISSLKSSLESLASQSSPPPIHVISPIPSFSATSKSSLSELRPITINQLQLNEIHRGRYILLQTVEPSFKLTAFRSIVKDTSNEIERIALYNFTSSDSFHHDASYALPVSTTLAVKEPYYKLAQDGYPLIRVDSPSDVVFLTNNDPVVIQAGWSNGSDELKKLTDSVNHLNLDSNSLKKVGNMYYKSKRYFEAIEAYKLAIAEDPLDHILYSNLSAAYLALEKFDEALENARKAISLDRNHLKSLFRMVKALVGLQRVEAGLDLLHETEKDWNGNKEMDDLLKRIHRIQRAKKGHFDLSELWTEAQRMTLPKLQLEDYIGPIKIGKIDDRKGYGLIAVTEIQAGTLLFTSKAVEIVYPNEVQVSSQTADFAVVDQAVTSLLTQRTINNFTEYSPLTRRLIYSLDAGPGFERLSPVTETPDDIELEDHISVANAQRISSIITNNAFVAEGVLPPVLDFQSSTGQPLPSAGFWITPSFVNHSCFGNCTRFFIGDIAFVIATRDIQQGEEITWTYVDPTASLARRQRHLSNYGFECDCDLCQFEKTVGENARSRRMEMLGEVENISADVTNGNVSRQHISKLETMLKEVSFIPSSHNPVSQNNTSLDMYRPTDVRTMHDVLAVIYDHSKDQSKCGYHLVNGIEVVMKYKYLQQRESVVADLLDLAEWFKQQGQDEAMEEWILRAKMWFRDVVGGCFEEERVSNSDKLFEIVYSDRLHELRSR